MIARELFNQMVIVLNADNQGKEALSLRQHRCLSGADLYSPENLDHLMAEMEAMPDCAKEKDEQGMTLLHHAVKNMRIMMLDKGCEGSHRMEMPAGYENFLTRLIALNKDALSLQTKSGSAIGCALTDTRCVRVSTYEHYFDFKSPLPLLSFLLLAGMDEYCDGYERDSIEKKFKEFAFNLLPGPSGAPLFQPPEAKSLRAVFKLFEQPRPVRVLT